VENHVKVLGPKLLVGVEKEGGGGGGGEPKNKNKM
jgi:hypothetical protein